MNYSFIFEIILSILGGILGAAIGGLNSFILCGLSFLIGTIINSFSANPSSVNIISWGPFLGPHVAFSGGVAAAAYAASIGKITTGRDIVIRLARLNLPMVYVVGGVFGLAGYALKTSADLIPAVNGVPWMNSIAFSITVSGIAVRVIFGRSGLVNSFQSGYASWQPWKFGNTVFLIASAGLAIVSASIVHRYPSLLGVMFGASSLSLILLYFKVKIPIVLHIAWSAEFVTYLSGDIGLGITFGILTAVVGEICAYLFLVDGETHIDPPAMSLTIIFSIYPLLMLAGLIETLKPYTFLIAALMMMFGILLLGLLEKQSLQIQRR